jgi:DNA mismatch repair ATPase MutL
MKKLLSVLLVCLYYACSFSQETVYPRFEDCADFESIEQDKLCFETTLITKLKSLAKAHPNFDKIDQTIITIIFDVDNTGRFNIIFIDSSSEEVSSLINDIFKELPVVSPATAFGNPTFMQFDLELNFKADSSISTADITSNPLDQVKQEIDSINASKQKYDGELFDSYAYIPLSHEIYNRFDREINLVGTNVHSAQKHYTYKDIKKYYDFKTENEKLSFNKKSWLGRKLFDEHLATLSGKGYWLAVDFGVDLQLGYDTETSTDTYNNTRIGFIQGGIGKRFTYYAAIFESQGRFAR